MSTLREQWRRAPRISRVSWICFVVLILLVIAIGAVFFPDGGNRFAYAFIPVGLNMTLMGGLAFFNHRGTADALLGMQQVMRRHLPMRTLRASGRANHLAAAIFMLFGLALTIAAPLIATS